MNKLDVAQCLMMEVCTLNIMEVQYGQIGWDPAPAVDLSIIDSEVHVSRSWLPPCWEHVVFIQTDRVSPGEHPASSTPLIPRSAPRLFRAQ